MTGWYDSPFGRIRIDEENGAVTGLISDPDHPSGGGNTVTDEAFHQLEQYFNGERLTFDIALAPKGTPFQLLVWKELEKVPYGCCVSYSDIARMLGRPGAARAVGAACGRNPIWILIPCHRVVGKNGKLTGYAGGLEKKKCLLRLEGIYADKKRTDPASGKDSDDVRIRE